MTIGPGSAGTLTAIALPAPSQLLDTAAASTVVPVAPKPAATGPELGGPADDLTYLSSCGLTRRTIAEQAGMDTGTLTCAAAGRRLAARTTTALRTLRLAWTPPPGHVLALPGVRRLQALAFIAHTPAEIAADLDRPTLLVWEWTTGEHRFLPVPAAAAVDRVYRERALTPGPNREIAAYARSQQWVSPLAWDDDTLDDPGSLPDTGRSGGIDRIVDPIAVERALAGDHTVAARLTRHERHAAVRLGRRRGKSGSELAALLGCSERQVWPTRAGRDHGPTDPFVAYYRFADLLTEAA